jgi:hypothetical protein
MYYVENPVAELFFFPKTLEIHSIILYEVPVSFHSPFMSEWIHSVL